ncbi:prenyltransferase/squalene oxidase repeat-containing protein [Rhodopirellula sp. SWK7]|uniref:prenyltransferase/squalene oxidase repeat-containing protein n=1 Tax=Rhodopirellula sp. SWK7 TaxID=595460 RepID=UPI0011819E58|nr:prenyltransferase/squalene oxidase repeat-containing protein [Rhodopirellula sp. SWK7]
MIRAQHGIHNMTASWLVMMTAVAASCVGMNRSLAEDTSSTDVAAERPQNQSRLQKLDFRNPPVLPDVESPSVETMTRSIRNGVKFLIADQNPNGSWGSPTNTKDLNIYAPVPGAHHAFRAATTSLCLSALLECGDVDDASVQEAIERGEAWLFDYLPKLRRADGTAMYNVWGHAYAIEALAHLHRHHGDDTARMAEIESLIEQQFGMLRKYESVDGGWGYYDMRYQAKRPTSSSISFVGGAALVAMHRAKSIGIDPPEDIVKRAVAAIHRQQKPDFTYLYGEYLKDRPMREINRPGGSLGRSQCCNVALRFWGDAEVTDNVLKHWLYRLYERNGWLDIGRKRPVPHESWFQVAGYFYYFGHYYAAMCIDELPVAQRGPYQAMLADLIVPLQEKNGCWWDYPLYDYHRPYGTAMALMTLKRCLPAE